MRRHAVSPGGRSVNDQARVEISSGQGGTGQANPMTQFGRTRKPQPELDAAGVHDAVTAPCRRRAPRGHLQGSARAGRAARHRLLRPDGTRPHDRRGRHPGITAPTRDLEGPGATDLQNAPRRRRRPPPLGPADHTGPVGRCPGSSRSSNASTFPAGRWEYTQPARSRRRRHDVLLPPRPPLPEQTPDQTHHPQARDRRAHRRRRGSKGGRPTGFDKEKHKRRNEAEQRGRCAAGALNPAEKVVPQGVAGGSPLANCWGTPGGRPLVADGPQARHGETGTTRQGRPRTGGALLTSADADLQAVGVGFEPTVTRATTVFKTVPLGRSGSPPAPRLTWRGAATAYRLAAGAGVSFPGPSAASGAPGRGVQGGSEAGRVSWAAGGWRGFGTGAAGVGVCPRTGRGTCSAPARRSGPPTVSMPRAANASCPLAPWCPSRVVSRGGHPEG